MAVNRDKIIVTMDKDFGYLAQAYNPPGILLLRLRAPCNTSQARGNTTRLAVKRKTLRIYNGTD